VMRVYLNDVVNELQWRYEIKMQLKREIDRVVWIGVGMILCGVRLAQLHISKNLKCNSETPKRNPDYNERKRNFIVAQKLAISILVILASFYIVST